MATEKWDEQVIRDVSGGAHWNQTADVGPQDPAVLRLREVFLEFKNILPKSGSVRAEVRLNLAEEKLLGPEPSDFANFTIVVQLRALFDGALGGKVIRELLAFGDRYGLGTSSIGPVEGVHHGRSILILEGGFNRVDVYSYGVGVKALEKEKEEIKKPWNMRDRVITVTSTKLGEKLGVRPEATLGTFNDPEVKAALETTRKALVTKKKEQGKKKAVKR